MKYVIFSNKIEQVCKTRFVLPIQFPQARLALKQPYISTLRDQRKIEINVHNLKKHTAQKRLLYVRVILLSIPVILILIPCDPTTPAIIRLPSDEKKQRLYTGTPDDTAPI